MKFHWQPGLTLSYKVAQATKAIEVTGNGSSETKTKLNLIKQWRSPGCGRCRNRHFDSYGYLHAHGDIATLGRNTHLRFGRPHGWRCRVASSDGQICRSNDCRSALDDRGKVVEVKESKFGPPSRFDAELPFQMVLPGEPAREGVAWNRTYSLKLDPPHGAGETYECVQAFRCKQVTPTSVLVSCQTTIPKLPENAQDQVPLLQNQTQGEVVFDVENGRLDAAVIQVNKELKDHQGKDSSYKFQSVYRESYLGK